MTEPLSPQEEFELVEYEKKQADFVRRIKADKLSHDDVVELAGLLLDLQSSQIKGAFALENWTEIQRENCSKIIDFLLQNAKDEYLDEEIIFPTALSQKEPLIYTPRKRLKAIQKQLTPRQRR